MASSKRILIIGGSGRTGKLVINELQQQGHQVTALVRNITSMKAETEGRLQVVTGTPMNKEDVRKVFAQCRPDVVIVTLSAPRANDSPFAAVVAPPRLMADSTANVVAAMKEFGTPKIVIMQAYGVGESWTNMPCVLQLLMAKSNMIYQYNDHNLVAEETKKSGVTHVFVRPSRLVEGDAQKIREWANNGKGVPMMASISRGSVAKFIAQATESREWDNAAPVITN